MIRVCTAMLDLCPYIENRSLFTVIPSMNVFATVKIVSEYDQEIPQSQTADKPMAP